MQLNKLSPALALAIEAHQGQIRKSTQIPYISHPMAVASIALEFGASEDQAIAALLHDAIEDGGNKDSLLGTLAKSIRRHPAGQLLRQTPQRPSHRGRPNQRRPFSFRKIQQHPRTNPLVLPPAGQRVYQPQNTTRQSP